MNCAYCGLPGATHRDHVVPRSRGGYDTPHNLVMACPACNMSKGCKLPSEWLRGRHIPAPIQEIEDRISFEIANTFKGRNRRNISDPCPPRFKHRRKTRAERAAEHFRFQALNWFESRLPEDHPRAIENARIVAAAHAAAYRTVARLRAVVLAEAIHERKTVELEVIANREERAAAFRKAIS